MRQYNKRLLLEWMRKCKRKDNLHYSNTDPYLYRALEKYKIEDKSVLIIGSQEPCYEALALLNKAKYVTTVEYQELSSTYKRLRVLTVPRFENDNTIFDCAFSISSVEHSGLGRYGDPIDIDGDLKAMKLLHDKIKIGGICFLAVPIGADRTEGNLHRVYGKERLPLLLKGWNVLERFGFDENIFNSSVKRNQPLFILERI